MPKGNAGIIILMSAEEKEKILRKALEHGIPCADQIEALHNREGALNPQLTIYPTRKERETISEAAALWPMPAAAYYKAILLNSEYKPDLEDCNVRRGPTVGRWAVEVLLNSKLVVCLS